MHAVSPVSGACQCVATVLNLFFALGVWIAEMKKIRKAVLPVAGLGTRVLPATKAIPKEMLPIVDRPVIEYVVAEALEAGIEHIVFVTGRGKGVIEDHFDRAYELEAILQQNNKQDILHELQQNLPMAGSTSFVRQQAPLGLGHAIWCARDVIGDEPFAVLLPDVLIKAATGCLAQMVEVYEKTGGNIIAVDEVPAADVDKYGMIDPVSQQGNLYQIRAMVEKPAIGSAPSRLKITGRYILQPELFGLLQNQQTGAGGEIQLTDAMARLMQTQDFHALQYQGTDFDCGNKPGYLRAIAHFALAHPELGEAAKHIFEQALDQAK
ncbi:UTP--glucose-1-phosphate uridylyltransferase [hydrothermal vent metagenome]|uniref:UTP--glucose-1-phosphate uridylyltransferase n=1 Tax=hydrothermal vent metagenome TaxID=652676 RepID=A0A3B0R5Y3_9ZZZZ